MNPLILSLVCLLLVGVSANWLSIVKDNNVPFYVALPSSTIDWKTKNSKDIPIEERNSDELSKIDGVDENGDIKKVQIYPKIRPTPIRIYW